MSPTEGVEYIRDQLVNGELIMADATEKTGWSFPRVRSRAITVCKRLGGKLEKKERGVYVYESVTECMPVGDITPPTKDDSDDENTQEQLSDEELTARINAAEEALLDSPPSEERNADGQE